MKKTLILNSNVFRYAVYENTETDQFGVFLLGALQDIDSVDFFSKEFSKVVNTIVIEVPGSGETEVLQATVSVRDQAQMIVDLLAFLKVDRAHLLGFSYATSISVELCDLWSGVQSFSMGCGVPGIPENARMATFSVIAAAMESKKAFANTFVDVLMSDNSSILRNKVIRRSIVAGVMKFDQNRVKAFIENTIRLLSYKPTNLERVTVPAMVIAGEHDPYILKNTIKKFHEKLKNASFVILKDTDHLAHLQQPQKMADALITLAKHHRLVCDELKTLEG